MSRNYYQFGKKHFEYEMRGILIRNKLGFMSDVTDEINAENPEMKSWEHIYKVSTKNKSLEILVYSSIDVQTGFVRQYASDAVRIVLRWKTKNGYVYKKVAKHLRIETLFSNVEKSLLSVQPQVFNLNYKEFSKNIA